MVFIPMPNHGFGFAFLFYLSSVLVSGIRQHENTYALNLITYHPVQFLLPEIPFVLADTCLALSLPPGAPPVVTSSSH